MDRPIPINKAAAEKQLADAYTELTGKAPDMMVNIVIGICIERALSGERWEWRKEESENWSVSLHWL